MFSEKHQIWGLVLLIILLITIGAIISIILLLNQRKFHFNKKLSKVESDFQENILITRIEIQEQTFTQISREIHDHIGQRLTLARLYINKLASKMNANDLDILFESSGMIEEAIRDLKNLSRSLTANIIETEGLIPALQLEINRVKKITQTDIELRIIHDEKIPFLDEEKELIIYRIIQEALQNIMRHAEATNVLICFIFKHDYLELTIEDNGKGFNQEDYKRHKSSHSSGLSNLRKRAEMMEGDFSIISSPGEGTTLSFRFAYITKIQKHATSQTSAA